MSTLTALKLERELEISRRAMAEATGQPKLVMKWGLDSETGRPEAFWVAVQDARPDPVFF